MVGNPVSWFGIHAADLDRAKKFYETVFGETLQEVSGGGMRFMIFGADWAKYGVSGMLWSDGVPCRVMAAPPYFSIVPIVRKPPAPLWRPAAACCRTNSRLPTAMPPLLKTAKATASACTAADMERPSESVCRFQTALSRFPIFPPNR